MSESKSLLHPGANSYFLMVKTRTTDLSNMSRYGEFFIEPGAQIPRRRSRLDITLTNSSVINLNFA